MTGHKLQDVVLRAAGIPSRIAAATDGELLGWFVAERDAAAFAELVRRHGAMVLGVARRELGDTPDADDVCQATFLVLARKAASVRRADAIGAWLYGVARRVARKHGKATARRRGLEKPLADLPGPDTTVEVSLRDGLRVLDEELARLPDAHRAPLVLCYLEGRTQDEAARQLGWSLGSFRGRLERGRTKLRDRLTRRGVGLAVLAAAAVAKPASISAAVQSTIINSASAVAAGEALAVPAAVAALAEGAIRTMTVTKLQWVGAAAVCGMLTVGGVWATGQGPRGGGQPPAGAPGQPPVAGQAKVDAPVERVANADQRRKSLNNLKQIMLAVHNYNSAYGHLPADIRDTNGKVMMSWRVAILPFLEQDNAFKQFKLDEPWDSEHNLKLAAKMPAVYRVGIEPKDSTHTHYQVFACSAGGVPLHPSVGRMPAGLPPSRKADAGGAPAAGAFPGVRPGGLAAQQIRLADITDGTSFTLGVVEAGIPIPWTKPADIPFDPKTPLKFITPFSNEWHAAMMDGSAYAFKCDINQDSLRTLILMNDGAPPPVLDHLRAPTPAETPESKEQLQKRIDENQQTINRIRDLMAEEAELIALQNRRLTNIDQADGFGDWLKRRAEEFARRNKISREALGVPPGAPIPKGDIPQKSGN